MSPIHAYKRQLYDLVNAKGLIHVSKIIKVKKHTAGTLVCNIPKNMGISLCWRRTNQNIRAAQILDYREQREVI